MLFPAVFWPPESKAELYPNFFRNLWCASCVEGRGFVNSQVRSAVQWLSVCLSVYLDGVVPNDALPAVAVQDVGLLGRHPALRHVLARVVVLEGVCSSDH